MFLTFLSYKVLKHKGIIPYNEVWNRSRTLLSTLNTDSEATVEAKMARISQAMPMWGNQKLFPLL